MSYLSKSKAILFRYYLGKVNVTQYLNKSLRASDIQCTSVSNAIFCQKSTSNSTITHIFTCMCVMYTDYQPGHELDLILSIFLITEVKYVFVFVLFFDQ